MRPDDHNRTIYSVVVRPQFYFTKTGYNSTPTAGGLVKTNLAKISRITKTVFGFTNYFWLGFGGQFHHEGENEGNPDAPLQTPGVSYEDVLRGDTLRKYLIANPTGKDTFPYPKPTSASYYKISAWMGFNLKKSLGPVRLNWNDLSFSVVKKRPDSAVTEIYNDIEKDIYISEFTDERYEYFIVDEMQWILWPKYLDLNIGFLFSQAWDNDNSMRPDDHNRTIYSVVVRPQFYFTKEIHALLEVSLARENSTAGNRYREHYDSLEKTTNGNPDIRGLEWGDTDVKNTLQLKVGPVINPNGRGIYNRPSIRILFGAQYSNVHTAFGNSYIESLEQRNIFNKRKDIHWHYLISIEAEHWWGSY
jgi:hypothetical protein